MSNSGEARKWAPENYTSLPSSEISRIAASRRRRFTNKGMRIGNSNTVHAVRLRKWINGEEIPAPACHIGADIPDTDIERRPVSDQPVNCRRCLSYKVAREEGQPYQPRLRQIGLWPLEEERNELPAWPPPEPE